MCLSVNINSYFFPLVPFLFLDLRHFSTLPSARGRGGSSWPSSLNTASRANDEAVQPSSFMCPSKTSHSSGDMRKEKGTLRRFSRGMRGLPLGLPSVVLVLSFTRAGGSQESSCLYTLWSGSCSTFCGRGSFPLSLLVGTLARTRCLANSFILPP